MSPPLTGTSHIFQAGNITRRPLHLVTKQYILAESEGAVLILVHGSGYNKEIWEPFLQDLKVNQDKPGNNGYISEAWTFDCPNHGQAAGLNEDELKANPADISLDDFARVGLGLLLSGLIQRLDRRPLVFAGHSAGALSAIILAAHYHQETHRVPNQVILIEPPAELFRSFPAKKHNAEHLFQLTKERRDVWESKESAKEWFAKRIPWKLWDSRALDAYVDGGLRPLPTAMYPETKSGVTLSCYKIHEAFTYINLGELYSVTQYMERLQHALTFSVIFGQTSFLKPKMEQENELTSKYGFSVDTIGGAGHLVVQESPAKLALLVYTLLGERKMMDWQRSKL